jgi:hypothetical protein
LTIPLDYAAEGERIDTAQSEAILRSETQALAADLPTFNKYRDYYDGDQLLSYGTDRFKEDFGEAFTGLVSNWCEPVVDAVLDKLEVIGVNVPGAETLSKEVWNTLRRNDLDEQQEELHEGVLVESRAYAIVWPDPDLGVRFDWQPAQNVRIRYADDDDRTPVWAMKRWVTPSGVVRVNLYFADRIEKWQGTSEPSNRSFVPQATPSTGLQPFIVDGEPWPLPNPFNEIPVVEFSNRKGSEIKGVIPQQDAVNYLLTSAFGAAEYNALRQKVMMTNADEPTGGWSNLPGRIWHLPHPLDSDGKPIRSDIGEFSSTDLAPYRSLVEMTLQHIALTTKTPVRMFFQSDRGGRGDAPSGDSLRVEDQPLIDKAQSKQKRLGNSWYRVVGLVAKAITGDNTLALPPGEVVWQDLQADYRSALLDDAVKMMELRVPYEFIITKLGLNPEEIRLLEELGPEEVKAEPVGFGGEPTSSQPDSD